MSEQRRRRTERLFLRYPIQVVGADAGGRPFEETTHSIVVNRHGGRILLKTEVLPGQTIKITQVVSGREADFRVVGLAGPSDVGGGEWGVECHDENVNFWGINFPPLDESQESSSVLLECAQCHEVALTHFSMVEYDLLESSGILVRKCNACKRETEWAYSLNPTRVPESLMAPVAVAPVAPPDISPPVQSAVASPVTGANRRTSPRIPLRLPTRVRNSKDITDLTKSENVSKGGLAFTSGFMFELGETLYLTCPYDLGGSDIEIQGRVVRRDSIAGTGRYLYGVEYQK